MMQSTPLGMVMSEAGLRPALSLLNILQQRCGLQILSALVTQLTYDILSPLLTQSG